MTIWQGIVLAAIFAIWGIGYALHRLSERQEHRQLALPGVSLMVFAAGLSVGVGIGTVIAS